MSLNFCVFENTVADISRCLERMKEGRLSEEELRWARRLHALALKMVSDYPPEEGIEELGEHDKADEGH